jgi:hypothetical protein
MLPPASNSDFRPASHKIALSPHSHIGVTNNFILDQDMIGNTGNLFSLSAFRLRGFDDFAGDFFLCRDASTTFSGAEVPAAVQVDYMKAVY